MMPSTAGQSNTSDGQKNSSPRPARWAETGRTNTIRSIPQLRTSRVCDRCIKNKVKCGLQRPSCSRCVEGGTPCVYSSTKRKPGPVKGMRRSVSSVRGHAKAATRPSLEESQSFSDIEPTATAAIDGTASHHIFSSPDVAYLTVLDHVGNPEPPQASAEELFVTPEQELSLLESFFEKVHSAIPLFGKAKFLRQRDNGQVSRDIVLVIIAITASLLKHTNSWNIPGVDHYLQHVLASTSFEDVQLSEIPSLEQFKMACLLAYYEFHQYPGTRAWMRIGRLTRQAYRVGLNQIENPQICSVFDWNGVSAEEIEEWRYVWWCVYCFDSYSNLASGTPLLIELAGINTALPTRSLDDLSVGSGDSLPKVSLSTETDMLWKTLQEIYVNTSAFSFNIHIVTTTILREAGTVARLLKQNPSDRMRKRSAALEGHLSALRLALPPNHLNPTRNVLQHETNLEHHSRLTTVLHLHLARIFICIPFDLTANETLWISKWQQILGSCQDIASVVAQWDSQFSPSIDPAVCLIVFVALLFSNLHKKCMPEGWSHFESCEHILSLFLDQFAKIWSLPRQLLSEQSCFGLRCKTNSCRLPPEFLGLHTRAAYLP